MIVLSVPGQFSSLEEFVKAATLGLDERLSLAGEEQGGFLVPEAFVDDIEWQAQHRTFTARTVPEKFRRRWHRWTKKRRRAARARRLRRRGWDCS